MAQSGVAPDSLYLHIHDAYHILLHLVIVGLDDGFHLFLFRGVIVEVRKHGYLLIGFCLSCHPISINHNFGMENFLVDALVEVVRDRTDEHTLCQCGYFAGRNEAIHLSVERVAHILTIDAHRLPFL